MTQTRITRGSTTRATAERPKSWQPASILPEFELFVDKDSRFKDNIEVQGLLLCKIPTEFMDQRRDYYSGKNKSQMDSVDNNFMRESDVRMPLFNEKRSSTSFGKGR